MRKILYSIATIAGLTLASCGGDTDQSTVEHHHEIDTSAIREGVGDEMYDRARAMFYSMPSPLELQSLIMEAGGYYREDLPHDPQTSSQYQTTEQQAFALGVFGTDMCYSSVFDQQQDAMKFLAGAQRVAKKMGIQDPFSGALLARADNNINNKDSMLLIVSEIYWELNSQLQEENRNQIGLIILAAGWVEGVYLGTQILDKSKSEDKMVQVLIDQRFIAGQLDQLFKDYKDDPFIATTEPYFREMIDTYLAMPLNEAPAEVTEVNGKTVIGGATSIQHTQADINALITVAAKTRANIIQL